MWSCVALVVLTSRSAGAPAQTYSPAEVLLRDGGAVLFTIGPGKAYGSDGAAHGFLSATAVLIG